MSKDSPSLWKYKSKIAKDFAPLKDKWLVNKPEEQVRPKYICHLEDSYGYYLDQMAQELQVNNSLRVKQSLKAVLPQLNERQILELEDTDQFFLPPEL